ncbi:14-3-3-like protein F, partial [Phalaenopsis equestris]|uniref:14-3-3-like protein F n=1 Tax=Phalaenopsis equestris TaxID=78828 RepID=UPI0009E324D8
LAESVDDILYLVQLAEQSERYDDMVEFMEKVTEAAEAEQEDLTADERNLLSLAYKCVIGPRRAAWRTVSLAELKEESRGNADRVNAIKEYRAKIESELTTICGGILNQLESRLIPLAVTDESKVFYHKLKGDYYRYLAEFKTESDRKDAADKTLEAYQSAMDIAVERLSPHSILRLGLALNFSVFYFEILNYPREACTLAKRSFIEATNLMDDTFKAQPEYKECSLILQLLRENLELWASTTPAEDLEEEKEASNREEEEE